MTLWLRRMRRSLPGIARLGKALAEFCNAREILQEYVDQVRTEVPAGKLAAEFSQGV